MKNPFQIGDVVVCKPGYNNNCDGGNPENFHGGGGYIEGEELVIGRFDKSYKGYHIAWVTDSKGKERGIYCYALEYPNQEPNYEVY